MSRVLRDARTVFVRESLPGWREPWGHAFGMVQPLVFLGLFGPLLEGVPGMAGAMPDGAADAHWQWFVPAILVMLSLFGTAGTGYTVLTEIQTGAHERMLVTPMSRHAMLVGRTLKDVQELLAQAVLIVVVMLPFGFTLHPAGALLGLAMLAVLGVSMGSLSHALAIACRKQQEMFYLVQTSLLFPLVFLSGMMLPLEMGPGWMRTAGDLNPLTYIVEALRALFAGRIAEAVVLQGWLVAAALAVVGVALGTRAMSRSHT
ncbi:ABC transporter permease [Egibacter rhizosphaerae]|uniref:Transport permease protein n=1 Tax=Egibacter rhizosphaerae TaxID=1670831 RepID=A0A411YFC7_9ACTN|nr:ABC transporter permease [Egibacter rhizosphaerae]QBI19879.1 ABC transporter permease [Egibacter rhizosphaerae]